MPRNGSGVYSLPAAYFVEDGDTSAASQIVTPFEDLEADLNTARPVVAGGTAATTAADARTNLGLVIGTDVQAYDAGLASIAGLTTAADKMIYTTALDTYAVADLSSFARTILDDANASAVRATIGVTIGTDVQAYDAGLASIAGLTTAADRMIYTTASDTYAVTTLTSFGRSLIDDADAAAGRTTLGLGALATLATVDTAQIDDDAVTLAKIADAALSGLDSTVITGTAGTDGNYAIWNSDGDLVDGPTPGEIDQNTQTGTTYTLVLADKGKVVEMSNASANTLTIPAEASVAFPVGTVIQIDQIGAGTTTVQGDTGVVVNNVSAGSGAINARFSGVTIRKRASDSWVMQGDYT